MAHRVRSIQELLARDRRYRREAYVFVFEALRYAHDVMGLGCEKPNEPRDEESEDPEESLHRHLTGQELCEAIRRYALEQFGFMAKTVLNSWGLHSTRDFGEIVFSLIEIGEMRKTKDDRIEDFDDVFDFETGLRQDFRITVPEEST